MGAFMGANYIRCGLLRPCSGRIAFVIATRGATRCHSACRMRGVASPGSMTMEIM